MVDSIEKKSKGPAVINKNTVLSHSVKLDDINFVSELLRKAYSKSSLGNSISIPNEASSGKLSVLKSLFNFHSSCILPKQFNTYLVPSVLNMIFL